MGWTPHTREELERAGVVFGSANSMPSVVILPDADGVTRSSSSNRSTPYLKPSTDASIPISVSSGNSASSLKSTSGTISVPDSLAAVTGSGYGDMAELMKIIQENTDKNNSWSAQQAASQNAFQERMNSIAMDFNSMEAAKNRDWQEYMSNTAHQREVADLRAAGLNPVLSASGGNGAAVGSGATASGVTSAGSKGDTDESGNAALASLYGALINAQTQMYNANVNAKANMAIAERQVQANILAAELAAETNRYGYEMSAEASKYGSSVMAGAQNYAADLNWKNNEAQREWNANHPSNPYQLGASLVGGNISGSASGILNNLNEGTKATFNLGQKIRNKWNQIKSNWS